MPKRFFSDGVEIVHEDLTAISDALLKGLYDRTIYQMLGRSENAFFGDSFLVTYSSGNSVLVKKGLGFITDAAAISPQIKRKPLVLDDDEELVIATPHASLARIDIVCVKDLLVDEIEATRNFKDAATNEVTEEEFVVQKDFGAELLIVEGTADPAPVAPSTPVGYIKICTIAVTAVSGITGATSLTDNRSLMPLNSISKGVKFIEDAIAPISDLDSGVQAYKFAAAAEQSLYAMFRVPSTYIPGLPIKLKLLCHSGDSSGNFLMTTLATLLRPVTDAISSTTNQRTSTNTAFTTSAGTVNKQQSIVCDLTDYIGKINNVAVSPGDVIKIQLYRGTDTAIGDVKVVPENAEVVVNV